MALPLGTPGRNGATSRQKQVMKWMGQRWADPGSTLEGLKTACRYGLAQRRSTALKIGKRQTRAKKTSSHTAHTAAVMARKVGKKKLTSVTVFILVTHSLFFFFFARANGHQWYTATDRLDRSWKTSETCWGAKMLVQLFPTSKSDRYEIVFSAWWLHRGSLVLIVV